MRNMRQRRELGWSGLRCLPARCLLNALGPRFVKKLLPFICFVRTLSLYLSLSLVALHILLFFKAFGMGPSSAVVSGLETRRVVFELQHIAMPNGSRVTEKGGSDALGIGN